MQIIALDSEKNQQSFTPPQFELGLDDTRTILQKVFTNRLPKRVLASDDPLKGVFEYPKWKALDKRLIQFNHTNLATKLVFDIDTNIRHLEQEGFESILLPEPSWVAYNKTAENFGRAHVCYELAAPVALSSLSSAKVIRYLADIEMGLKIRFGEAGYNCDHSYAGLLCKNPLVPDFYDVVARAKTFELDELAEWAAPLGAKPTRSTGFGRNCDLFENLRHWAYAQYKHFCSKEQFIEGTRKQGELMNSAFSPPLPSNEVKSVSKSIAVWTWEQRMEGKTDRRGRSFAEYVEKTHTPEIQRLRGLKSGAVRFEGSKEAEAPWVALGIHRATYYRRLKAGTIPVRLEPNQGEVTPSKQTKTTTI
ncbi:MAG: hypothetical protein CTY12_02170 [Methylotenera sp.]|nr:MAG: hypothetical protein CTY12_02170 [Methylotenera sp.]